MVGGFAGGAPKLCGRPEPLVRTVRVAILAGGDARRIAEGHIRILLGPLPCAARGIEGASGKLRIVGFVDPRGNRCHCGKISGGTGALVRRRAGANDLAGQSVLVGSDEARKVGAGLLMPGATIGVLHFEHPLKVPADFIEDVGSAVAGLRNLELNRLEPGPVDLPSPQQRPRGDSGVDHVTAIVAGVVPAADVVSRPRFARTGMKLASKVAGWMGIAGKLRSKIDGGATTLAVEAAHGEVISSLEDIAAHGEVPALPYPRNLDVIVARAPQIGEVCGLHGVA